MSYGSDKVSLSMAGTGYYSNSGILVSSTCRFCIHPNIEDHPLFSVVDY